MEVLINNLSNLIREYNLRVCEKISKKYGINKDELILLFEDLKNQENLSETKTEIKNIKKLNDKNVSESNSENKNESKVKIDEKTLAKSTKPQLTALCKERGLKVSGNKEDLITRLLEFSISENEGESKSKSETTIESKSTLKTAVSSKIKEVKEEQLLKKYAEQQSNTLEIRRNAFNNYEHSITKFVFRKEDKKVYGKQNDDGTVSELTKDDIEECKKYKFDYELPLNLNKKTTLNDVKVEEVEEVEEVEVEEEVEEIEEEVEEVEEVEEEVEEDLNEEDLIEIEEEEEYEEYEDDE